MTEQELFSNNIKQFIAKYPKNSTALLASKFFTDLLTDQQIKTLCKENSALAIKYAQHLLSKEELNKYAKENPFFGLKFAAHKLNKETFNYCCKTEHSYYVKMFVTTRVKIKRFFYQLFY